MTPDDTEQSVREAAYFLWEREGRPEGCALEHWTAAERIVAGREPGDLGSRHRMEAGITLSGTEREHHAASARV